MRREKEPLFLVCVGVSFFCVFAKSPGLFTNDNNGYYQSRYIYLLFFHYSISPDVLQLLGGTF